MQGRPLLAGCITAGGDDLTLPSPHCSTSFELFFNCPDPISTVVQAGLEQRLVATAKVSGVYSSHGVPELGPLPPIYQGLAVPAIKRLH